LSLQRAFWCSIDRESRKHPFFEESASSKTGKTQGIRVKELDFLPTLRKTRFSRELILGKFFPKGNCNNKLPLPGSRHEAKK
jgi:hypothetical protein